MEYLRVRSDGKKCNIRLAATPGDQVVGWKVNDAGEDIIVRSRGGEAHILVTVEPKDVICKMRLRKGILVKARKGKK